MLSFIDFNSFHVVSLHSAMPPFIRLSWDRRRAQDFGVVRLC